jgi:hypothetical protein
MSVVATTEPLPAWRWSIGAKHCRAEREKASPLEGVRGVASVYFAKFSHMWFALQNFFPRERYNFYITLNESVRGDARHAAGASLIMAHNVRCSVAPQSQVERYKEGWWMAFTEARTPLGGQKEQHPRHRWIVYLIGGLVALATLAVSATYVWLAFAHRTQPTTSSQADLFMESVIKRDGALGWKQLCPDLQAKIPIDELQRQAAQQRSYEANQGVTLALDYLGMHSQTAGHGDIHLYLVTAKNHTGLLAQRIYVLTTQQVGCVEDVQHVDLSGTDLSEQPPAGF